MGFGHRWSCFDATFRSSLKSIGCFPTANPLPVTTNFKLEKRRRVTYETMFVYAHSIVSRHFLKPFQLLINALNQNPPNPNTTWSSSSSNKGRSTRIQRRQRFSRPSHSEIAEEEDDELALSSSLDQVFFFLRTWLAYLLTTILGTRCQNCVDHDRNWSHVAILLHVWCHSGQR